MENVKQLAAAIIAARKDMKAVHKSGTNPHHHYSYSNLEDYLKAIEEPLEKNGLAVITSVNEVISEDIRQTKNGAAEYPVRVKLSTTLLHISGESITLHGWGEGQDAGDKATYKAITGGRKYALACLFNLATTDDPEADEEKEPQKQTAKKAAPAKQEPKPAAPSQYQWLLDTLNKCKTTAEVGQFSAKYKASINQLEAAEKSALVKRGLELRESLPGGLA